MSLPVGPSLLGSQIILYGAVLVSKGPVYSPQILEIITRPDFVENSVKGTVYARLKPIQNGRDLWLLLGRSPIQYQ